MLRIVGGSARVVDQVPYRYAPPGGGRTLTGTLEIETVRASGLAGFCALVAAADLQSRELPEAGRPGAPRLTGEVLAARLAGLCRAGVLPSAGDVAVVLAGDLYCGPSADRRGESGDVRGVWQAFADFGLVTGVSGNHDLFGRREEQAAFLTTAGRYLLDGRAIECRGLRLAGLGGIIGNPARPNRRTEAAFLAGVRTLLSGAVAPDLLVLHEPPGLPEQGLRGNRRLRELLEAADPTLVVCGHTRWPTALVDLGSGQALNVDARCIVLLAG